LEKLDGRVWVGSASSPSLTSRRTSDLDAG